MKRSILALALAATTFAAQAIDWVHVGTSEGTGSKTYMDVDVVSDATAVGGISQTVRTAGKISRAFVSVTRQECQQGFGVLLVSDLDGANSRKGGGFVLGSSDTIGDAIGEYLCARLTTSKSL